MKVPTPRTRHISYKRNETPLLERERQLSQMLCKSTSDTYKYAMNKLYLEVMQRMEDGKPKMQY